MRTNFKKLTIFSIILTILFAATFCCCLTGSSQAAESIPACHQSMDDNDASQNSDECNCNQSLAVLEKNVDNFNVLKVVSLLDIEKQVGQEFNGMRLIAKNHPPPMIYDTSPLYIKHTILRI